MSWCSAVLVMEAEPQEPQERGRPRTEYLESGFGFYIPLFQTGCLRQDCLG